MTKYSKNANADKFYTDPDVAKQMIDTLDLDAYDLIIEPSAGSWAFGRHLPAEKTICLDLYPDADWPETQQQDFFELDLEKLIMDRGAENVLIIGNPPYGRLSGMAMNFVKKSCINNQLLNIKTTVGFILSETFAKNSFKTRVPLTHTCTNHIHLGSPFYLFGDVEQPYNGLNTGWFLWEPIARQKEVVLRSSPHLTFHKKEEFLSLPNKDKCAIRGQGSGAGNVFWDDFENLSETTTRFCSGPGVRVLEDIDWSPYTKLTVGIPSLATAEIFYEVNKKLS